jgi:hypothetical protein
MAATITKLKTKRQRIRADQAALLRDAVLPYEVELPEQVRGIIGYIDQQTASENGWTFVMLSPAQNDAVVNYLVEHSKRPLVAVRLWSLCFKYFRSDTGEILLTREEFAEKLGTAPQHVSQVMVELVKIKAIITRRERVKGLRGPGLVRYFMNPNVATNLGGAARDKAQADAPLLTLMHGGAE